MALLTQAPKGTQDLLPRESAKWRTAEEVMRSEAAVHGFGEVRTPVFEHTELFLRSRRGYHRRGAKSRCTHLKTKADVP